MQLARPLYVVSWGSVIVVALPAYGGNKMYWTDRLTDTIQRANRDGSSLEVLAVENLEYPTSIALDVAEGKMYWGEQPPGVGSSASIRRANLDGSDGETLLTLEPGGVSSLTLDLGRRRMFWRSRRGIERADMDGSNYVVLMTAESLGLRNLDAFALDWPREKLYVAGFGEILRVDTDGSNPVAIFVPGFGDPRLRFTHDLEFDPVNRRLYWVFGSDYDGIRAVALDGTKLPDLITGGLGHPKGLALDAATGHLFWAATFPGTIGRVSVDGSVVEPLITEGLGLPSAITLDIEPPDCNANGVPDYLDVVRGSSEDCSSNGIPDECESDCNKNGVPDSCDIVAGTSLDCNDGGFGVPDECELATGASQDCDDSGVPDECELDCNANGLHDTCDVSEARSDDCNANAIPDECEIIGLGPHETQPVDHCSDAALVCPGALYAGATRTAGNDGEVSEACGQGSERLRDVWYRYVPNSDGVLQVALTAISQFSTDQILSVHTECPGTPANQLGCIRTPIGVLATDVESQRTYYIRVSSTAGASATLYRLSVSGPDCHLGSGDVYDCNGNITPDRCDLSEGRSLDADDNGLDDACEPDFGMDWLAVELNGEPIEPTAFVEVHPGDTITTEIFVRGWATEQLSAYRFTIDPAGYESGLSGGVGPAATLTGTPNLFVDSERADWLFFGRDTDGPTCVTVDTQHAWCTAEISGDECVLDQGDSYYLGTLVLDASAAARGRFVLTMGEGGFRSSLKNCEGSVLHVLDARPLAVHVQPACEHGGGFDECEVPTNRYLPVRVDVPGDRWAVRLTVEDAPSPFSHLNGQSRWVTAPHAISELAGVVDPEVVPEEPIVLVASLACSPDFADWTSIGVVYVTHEAIVPGARYRLDLLEEDRVPVPDNFMFLAEVATSQWGDVAGSQQNGRWTPPDNAVDIVIDVVTILRKFSNHPNSLAKARADLEPATPDHKIQILDVVMALDAFRGLPYPFPASLPPCDD